MSETAHTSANTSTGESASVSDMLAELTAIPDEPASVDTDAALASLGGDDAGDSIADKASDAEPKQVDDAEHKSTLAEIKAMLAGKAEPKAEPKAENASTANAQAAKEAGNDVADDLEASLIDAFGEDSGPKIAKSIGARVEKVIAAKLAELENKLEPYTRATAEIHNERVTAKTQAENREVADGAIESMISQNAGLVDFYGKSRSSATKEQVAFRDGFMNAAIDLAKSGRYQREDAAKMIRHAHAIALEEYRDREAEGKKASGGGGGGVQINRTPTKAAQASPAQPNRANQDRKINSLLSQLTQ